MLQRKEESSLSLHRQAKVLGKVEVDEKTPGVLDPELHVGAAPVGSGELLWVWGKGGAR